MESQIREAENWEKRSIVYRSKMILAVYAYSIEMDGVGFTFRDLYHNFPAWPEGDLREALRSLIHSKEITWDVALDPKTNNLQRRYWPTEEYLSSYKKKASS